jgi:hypothetical protein|tara:strand:- start:115 stop:843 length:729 start_codon:yes stop_codon:yes gene_type:complete
MSITTHKLLQLVEKYSFNKQNIQELISSEYFEYTVKPKTKNIKEKVEIEHTNFFLPQEDDTVFWCWLLFKLGFSEYEILKETNFIIEKQYKIEFISKVRDNKNQLKQMKVKVAEMEGHLANDTSLSIFFLEAMLITEKYNFVYMNDKIYYENISYPGNRTCIIKYFEKINKYGLFLDEKKLFDYRDKLFIVDNMKKPIKGISSYKAHELKDICKKLNIEIMKTPTKSKTKKELYQLVIEKII